MATPRQGSFFPAPPSPYDAPADFDEAALTAIRSVAQRSAEFTTDDVWDLLTDYTMQERRRLGPLMIHAHAVGWIMKTGRYTPTRQPQANSRPIAIWRSRLYGQR